MKNKVLSILTIFALIINLVPISIVNAASNLNITVEGDKTNVKSGDTINYTVKLNTSDEIQAIQFTLDIPKGLTYDANSGKISSQLKTLKTNDVLDETELFQDISFSETNKTFIFLANDPYDMSGVSELMTFSCTVDSDASGNYNIGLSETAIADENGDDIANDSSIVKVGEAPVVITKGTTGISLNKNALSLENGKSEKLTATVEPSDATDKSVKWTTSDSSVATVASDGTVTAKKKGTATITAEASGGQKATCAVTVTQPVTDVKLNKSSIELSKDETEKLVATVVPSDADGDTTVEWSSSDTSVATVQQDGTVKAVGKGSTTITAKVGEKSATCTVTVGVPLKSIALNETEKELSRGETLQLEVTYNPADTDADKTVSYSSTNDSIASVSSTGLVTAKASGEATITATVAGKKASCKINVVVPIESVEVKEKTQLKVGESERLTATINPEDTSMDKTIEWTSSDETIATVSTDGTVKALAIGNAVITAKTINGKTDTCDVEVLPVPLNSIAIEQNITLNKNATKQLTITYNPENTTDSKEATWESDDESVATVSEGGLITAVGTGKTTITATVGDKTTTTEVTVVVALESISLNETSVNLNKEEDVQLSVSLNPTDTTETPVIKWSSSNEAVAKVSDDGKVTAVSGGTAYITAKVDGKDIEEKCEVNVVVPLSGVSFDKTGYTEPTKLIKGQTLDLGSKAKALPADTTDSVSYTYKSSDESIAKVDENGVVTGIKDGTATITVTAKVNTSAVLKKSLLKSSPLEFTDTWNIDVDEIPISGVVINKADFELKKGKQESLTATVLPADTTDDDKAVTWSSSDSSVATVDSNGSVKGIKEGTATITAKVGDKEATVNVTVVTIPITSVSLDGTDTTVKVGNNLDVQVKVNPEDTTEDYELEFNSSDSSILKVGEDGKIQAIGTGKAILTVSAGDGIVDQIEVEVIEASSGIDAEKDEQENTEESSSETSKEDSNVVSKVVKSISPKTGDLGTTMWIALMIVSALGIAFIIKTSKIDNK